MRLVSMIIGIIGAIGSGKDTIADYLVKHHSFTRLSFAGKVKDVAAIVFGWDRTMLEGLTKESRAWREEVDHYWGLSPRTALQRIGTEMFRTHIHPETWIKAVRRQIEAAPLGNYVITDCRFENEVAAVLDMGGQVWTVSRGLEPTWASQARAGAPCLPEIHSTDWNIYWLQNKASVKINNTGTLEDLYAAIERVL